MNHPIKVNDEKATRQRTKEPMAITTTTSPTIPIAPPVVGTTTTTKPPPPRQQLIPMTRHEYEEQQAQIRSVYDPESGRVRWVRGSGEIVEAIVSRSQHLATNQMATRTDGRAYTRHVFHSAMAHPRR